LQEVRNEEEQIKPFNALLVDDEVRVTDKDRYAELEESGYGTREKQVLALRDYEALYLLYSKKLDLHGHDGKEVSFEKLAELAQKKAGDSWTKFIIYRDLRSRGYVVREGFGFGTDLRVYERGEFPKKPAKYVVFALDEGIEKGISDLQVSVKEMAKMGKEAIIAVIERRGEVIYYKVSRARF
jgi:tRNA-intron endonuclease, archaea type